MTYNSRSPARAFALAGVLTLCVLVLNIGIAFLAATAHPPWGFRFFFFTDGFTESMISDAARSYAVNGLTSHAGLPSLSPEWVKASLPGAIISPGVHLYLHYPSLPYLLGGIGAKLFGTGNSFYLRIIALGINAGMLFLFLRGVLSVLATARQRCWFLFCFAIIPLGWGQMYGFAPNNYGHYDLLALIGILLPLLRADQPRLSACRYAAVGLFGFLAGCFTLDYFFVVLLTPLAVASLYHGESVFSKRPLRAVSLRLCAAVGLGFCFAQFLHLMQVSAYLGSIPAAVMEMRGAALLRSTSNAAAYHFLTGVDYPQFDLTYHLYAGRIVALGGIRGRLELIIDYLAVFSAVDPHREAILIAPIVFYLLLAAIYVGQQGDRILKRRFLTMAIVALTACILWICVMLNHSAVHLLLIAPHFYLIYILIVLFVGEHFIGRAKSDAPVTPEATHPSGNG